MLNMSREVLPLASKVLLSSLQKEIFAFLQSAKLFVLLVLNISLLVFPRVFFLGGLALVCTMIGRHFLLCIL